MTVGLGRVRTAPLALSLLLLTPGPSWGHGRSEGLLRAREHRQAAALHETVGSLRFCRRHPAARRFCTPAHRRWLRARLGWVRRELAETRRALRPPPRAPIPHLQQWLCIHSHEGPWTDTGAPHWGGLQMDWDFMAEYGGDLLRRKGTADHWTPLEQMMVAERAYASGRGFYPWPNTARMCGLI